MRDGDLGPAHAAPPGESGVLGGEIVLATHPADGAGRFDQHRGQPFVAVPFTGRGLSAGGLVHRRRQPGPGSQVGGGREP